MVYAVTRRLLSLPALLLRRSVSKEAELLVLRHQNAVLRRQVPRVRYEPADRLWFAALSHLIPRRRWAEVFAITPATWSRHGFQPLAAFGLAGASRPDRSRTGLCATDHGSATARTGGRSLWQGSPIMARRSGIQQLTTTEAQLHVELCRLRSELEQVRTDREILWGAAGPLIHLAPARERFAFIHAYRDQFSVRRLCRLLITDRSNYRAWVHAQVTREERARREADLLTRIREVHTAHPAYGAERVTRELKRQGVEVGRRSVARLMRQSNLCGITCRKRRNLTRPDQAAAVIPDLIQRRFTAPMPNLKLTGDITCFPTDEGWLSLATVLDLASKELTGYAVAPHMRTSLTVEAITMAHHAGLVAVNAIMHTNRGGQYHSHTYRNTLRRLDIRSSTSRTGSCLDGAAAESFFATIKSEIGRAHWPDRATARQDIQNWIKEYNERRLHSATGYQTPIATRTAWQDRMAMAT
jgi:transposase InsO family protein